MITLDLKERFSALARADHLLRVSATLTDLDISHGYSQQTDFNTRLVACISALADQGLHGATEQTQALYCVLTEACCMTTLLQTLQTNNSFDVCLKQCVEQSPDSQNLQQNLYRIKQIFVGLGRFDEIWLAPLNSTVSLPAAVNSKADPSLLYLACTHDGVLNSDHLPPFSEDINHLCTESGFRHKVSGKFTPSALIQQVCLQALPRCETALSLQAVVAQCSFGEMRHNKFTVAHHVALLDARQLQFKFDRRPLECPASDKQALQSTWQSQRSLSEAQVLVQKSLLDFAMQLTAAWEKVGHKFQFKVQGNASVEIQADAIQWHASLVHKGVRMYLTVQPEQNSQTQWCLSHAWDEGQLSFGEPFLIREHTVPVVVNCTTPLAVGQAVLSTPPGVAGYLTIRLQGHVNADTHCVDLELSLSHSELQYHWQFADALLGRSFGSSTLLTQAHIASWNVTHG